MDFYVDLAVAVLLRLLKDRRAVANYYSAVAKVYNKIRDFADLDPKLAAEIMRQQEGK
jgi:hypothetical protein